MHYPESVWFVEVLDNSRELVLDGSYFLTSSKQAGLRRLAKFCRDFWGGGITPSSDEQVIRCYFINNPDEHFEITLQDNPDGELVNFDQFRLDRRGEYIWLGGE